MQWMAVKVAFESANDELARELITHIFFELGLSGVVVEGGGPEGQLDWAEAADPLPGPNAIIGYFPDNETFPILHQKLLHALARLEQENRITSKISAAVLEEKDWADAWKAFFHPLKVGEQIVIKPTWRSYNAGPEEIVLEIDPGMAFGTGTHPSTALCIRMLEKYLPLRGSVLDIGTGSGILMVAAAKLGAGSGLGIDNDPLALMVAKENLALNRISESAFTVQPGDLLAGLKRSFDLVVANLFSKIILPLIDDLKKVLLPGGLFICSGIFEENAPAIVAELQHHAFKIRDMQTQEKWVVIVGERMPDSS